MRIILSMIFINLLYIIITRIKNNIVRKKQIIAEKSKKPLTSKEVFDIISIVAGAPDDNAGMAQSVEHILGKDEVISSILITSSIKAPYSYGAFLFPNQHNNL